MSSKRKTRLHFGTYLERRIVVNTEILVMVVKSQK